MSGLNWLCSPLTAVQNTQLQLSSSLVAAEGCSLRHSLQKTSGPGSGLASASAAESLASRLRVGLLLAMVGRDGGRNQVAPSPSAGN